MQYQVYNTHSVKKNEVPQDNEGLLGDKFRDLCYAVDEKGNYVRVHSTGWSPKNEAMKQAWEVIRNKVQEARQKVISGENSILAYHMEKNIMAIKLLSQYTGIPKRRIRRHLKPDIFQKLDHRTLEKYADAFNISIEELINIKQLYDEK